MESEHTEFKKDGIIIKEIWMGAATGEFQTILVVAISGIAGGLLSAIGKDLWGKLKTFLINRYNEIEDDRKKKEKTRKERKRLRSIHFVGEYKDVPIVYLTSPQDSSLSLSLDKDTLIKIEEDIKLLIHGNKVKSDNFLGINLDNIGNKHYLRKLENIPKSEADIIKDIHADLDGAEIYTHILLGMYFEDIAEDNRALEHYEIAEKNLKNDASIYVHLGMVYSRVYGIEKAKEAFQKSLDIDGDKAKFFYNLGCVYAIHGNVKEALKALRLSVENGYRSVGEMKRDPDFFNLRNEPEFEELQNKIQQLLQTDIDR